MTYFVSDIHGEYDLLLELLEKIRFSDSDTLYVLGDMIDRGDKSIKLVDYIRCAHNMKAILGNHECTFLQFYEEMVKPNQNAGNVEQSLSELQKYFPNDKESLSWETVAYLEQLPFYIETDDFICVHAGVKTDKNNIIVPMDKQLPQDMVFNRNFKSPSFVLAQKNKTVLFGHIPCSYENGSGNFIKTPKSGIVTPQRLTDYAKIRLDNGVYETGMLGVLRLEDMQEVYVKNPTARKWREAQCIF